MLRFVSIWGDLATRTASLLLRFYARGDLLTVAVSFVGGVSIVALLRLIPWWVVLIGILFLVLYAVTLAVYGKIKEIEDDKDALEGKLATAAKRKVIKDLLGVAAEQGEDLRPVTRKVGGEWEFTDERDVKAWVHSTRDFIEAVFDKGEALRFMDSNDYRPEEDGSLREIRVDPYVYYLTPRLRRLYELIQRANELEVNPDFYPRYWMDRFNFE